MYETMVQNGHSSLASLARSPQDIRPASLTVCSSPTDHRHAHLVVKSCSPGLRGDGRFVEGRGSKVLKRCDLRWAKSRDSYRRIASESSRRGSNDERSFAVRTLPKTEICPRSPCVRCAAIRIARWAFIRVTFVPGGLANGLREFKAFAECWRLAIGNFAHLTLRSVGPATGVVWAA